MKKTLLFVVLIAILLTSCTSTQQAQASTSTFSEIAGKEWKLIEVRLNGNNTGFSRNSLARDGFGEAFTINFSSDSLSGVGAPNRYSAPYTLGDRNTIDIGLVRSTLMAAVREPDRLREHDFFNYVQSANSWGMEGNNLVLYSRTETNARVILVFSL